MDLLRPVHAAWRARLKAGARATPADLSAYVAIGILLLYHGFSAELSAVADTGVTAPAAPTPVVELARARCWRGR
jgi:hypothetical protein